MAEPSDPRLVPSSAADPVARRAAFVAACLRFGREEDARLVAEIQAREARLAELGAELRAVSRERDRSQRRLAGVRATMQADEVRFAADFETLIALPHVRDVEVTDTRVRVLTEPWDMDWDGHRYRIGELAIDLDLVRGIRVTNLRNTSTSTGWDHPHVQGTVPCLGNLQEGCEVLLGQLELVPLAGLMLQFLEAYDPTTAYAPITLWQRVDA